ncbi:MAG: phosphoribosylglycinamide synthetase C domain-containing protein [Methylocella sp.]
MPARRSRGSEIHGVERAEELPFVSITHAGTKREGQRLIADGGRVLNVTGVGADVAEARARAYAAIDMIDWPDGFYRRDIGWRAFAHDPIELDRSTLGSAGFS